MRIGEPIAHTVNQRKQFTKLIIYAGRRLATKWYPTRRRYGERLGRWLTTTPNLPHSSGERNLNNKQPNKTKGAIEMTWAQLREKCANTKRQTENYYTRQIINLVRAGFKMADEEMEKLYTILMGEYDNETYEFPLFTDRKSTYPQIRKTEPTNGIYQYGTHSRCENIDEAIKTLAELHKNDEAWLMPVLDDDEYVSFELDVIVGSREEVINILRHAVTNQAAQAATNQAATD
jgi:hypothetical protein